jgi:Uma2 family endonuclease
MSTIAQITISQFDRMIAAGVFDDGQRIELIHGELREMTPIGPEHEIAVDKLTEWSFESLPKKKVWVRVQNSVGVPELDSAPEPDIAWVARRDYSKSRPTGADVLLMVEVAETSLLYDRGEKADLYAAARIQDYWIVNLVERSIEVHRKPSRGKYRSVTICGSDDRIHPLAFPKLSLAVKSLFR